MRGRVDISKLKNPPEKHELSTARYFAELGYDVEFIPPNNTPKMRSPDIVMDGVAWEIKSPIGKSRRTIENNFRNANRQSDNIIFDLRRIHLPEAVCMAQLEREFSISRHVKRVIVIKKSNEMVTFSKKGQRNSKVGKK